MSMLYVLIPLALMLLAVAVWALVWAVRSGQFDDLESHGWSVVLDDDQRPPGDPDDSDLHADDPDESAANGEPTPHEGELK
jgi:cbb3-type cytochrome oxidase maturation protein